MTKPARTSLPPILDAIGNTPLVALQRIPKDTDSTILAKVEYFSPTGSLKDRIYREMYLRAEERGTLRPGMTVLECSTGNAGTACAFLGAVLGYAVIVVMPEGMSDERKKLMRAYGADLVFTPGGESDVDLSLRKLEEIRREDPERYWVPAQFENADNVAAHYKTTGPEILRQADGRIDIFLASQGTGGTLTGVGKYLRENLPDVKLFAVEPAECPLLSKREWGPHKIEGIGDGFVPRNLHLEPLSGVVTTTSDEALDYARRMAVEEGIFCGISSGCNIAAAMKLAAKYPGSRIVTMVNDTGQRYFTTELCGEPKHVEVPDREHPMDDYTLEQLNRYSSDWVIVE